MEGAQPSISIHLGKLSGIDRAQVESELSDFQEMIFNEFGVIIPLIEVVDDDSLPENVFQVHINGQPQPQTESLEEGEFWLYNTYDQMDETFSDRSWETRPSVEPNTGSEAVIVRGSDDDMQLWKDAGYDTRSRQGYVVFCIAAEIRRQPAEFVNRDLVDYFLSTLNENYPDLVAVSDDMIGRGSLVEAIKDQLAAGNSINNLPSLLEELLETQI